MAEPTLKSVAAEHRVLGSLADGPKSCSEIADVLRQEVWDTWADKNGLEIEWDTDREPVGARLLAWSTAADSGLVHLFRDQVYPVLRRLERKGLVSRLQIAGRRPMLWVDRAREEWSGDG